MINPEQPFTIIPAPDAIQTNFDEGEINAPPGSAMNSGEIIAPHVSAMNSPSAGGNTAKTLGVLSDDDEY